LEGSASGRHFQDEHATKELLHVAKTKRTRSKKTTPHLVSKIKRTKDKKTCKY
jgi:hypothetical protein